MRSCTFRGGACRGRCRGEHVRGPIFVPKEEAVANSLLDANSDAVIFW